MQRIEFSKVGQRYYRRFKSVQSDFSHQGRVVGRMLFHAFCACKFRGPIRIYRYQAISDLLRHYDDRGHLEHPIPIKLDPYDVCSDEVRVYISAEGLSPL